MSRPLVFVLMSQRSGTSALVHTLNEHAGAAVGIERYKYLWPQWPDAYDAELFEAERFFALDESETNILGSERWETYYERKRAAWGPTTLSGDKVQPITRDMVHGILEATPRARFLYPFRQLLPLASSYAVRARNPDDENWAATRGAAEGRKVWQRDNRAVLDLLDDPELGPAVLPVAYEDFFPGDPVTVAAVLDHVGLPHDDPGFDAKVRRNAARYEQVQGKELALTYEEVDELLPHVHDPVHRELRARAPSRPRDDAGGAAPAQLRVAQLEEQVTRLDEQLTRLRGRRAVRFAVTVADTVGSTYRAARARVEQAVDARTDG